VYVKKYKVNISASSVSVAALDLGKEKI
jgi:hypothetical protein